MVLKRYCHVRNAELLEIPSLSEKLACLARQLPAEMSIEEIASGQRTLHNGCAVNPQSGLVVLQSDICGVKEQSLAILTSVGHLDCALLMVSCPRNIR